MLLDRALQRPGAVNGIEPGLRQSIACPGVEHEPDVALAKPATQVFELDVDDLTDVLLLERMEHDDVVDAIHELGPEMLARRSPASLRAM